MHRRLALIPLVLAMAAGSLRAQDQAAAPRDLRQGFWIAFGFGGGSMGVSCTSCTGGRTLDLAGTLKLGGTVNQHLLLGIETNGWTHSAGGVDQSLVFATGMAYWYPSATGSLYFSAGAGLMTFTQNDGVNQVSAAAPAGEAGAGFDIRVGRNFSITPFLNGIAASAASFAVNGQGLSSADPKKMSLVSFGIGVTWH